MLGTKLKEAFHHLLLTPIIGRPKYGSISTLFEQTCENAATVDSDLGGGNHGLTGLMVTPPVYETMSNTPFIAPLNPGPIPNIVNLTDVQARHATLMHTNAMTEHRKVQTFINIAHAMIIQAVPQQYIDNLKQPIVGYRNRSIQEIFLYLYQLYGRLSPADAADAIMELHEDVDPTSDPTNLWTKIRKARETCAACFVPLPLNQIMAIAYTVY